MARATSFAGIMQDWENLLAALKERAELLPTLEAESIALEKTLAEARLLKVQQESQKAGRQELTQRIKTVVAHGSEVAIAIRAVAKGKVGFRNERLVHFGVSPFRKRVRKPVVVVKPPDEEPTDEPTEPEAKAGGAKKKAGA